MHALPLAAQSFDVATIHMALHHAEQPRDVIAEAARVIRPGGHLVVVDFAPHEMDVLRTEHAHQRLGFADEDIQAWFDHAGMAPAEAVRIPGRSLTVCLWCARKAANDPVVQPTLVERSAV
jgi:ArsR family transcriptional regulator